MCAIFAKLRGVQGRVRLMTTFLHIIYTNLVLVYKRVLNRQSKIHRIQHT